MVRRDEDRITGKLRNFEVKRKIKRGKLKNTWKRTVIKDPMKLGTGGKEARNGISILSHSVLLYPDPTPWIMGISTSHNDGDDFFYKT